MTKSNSWTAPDGKTLGEKRTELQISRRELAELSHLTQSRIWRLEHMDAFEADADKGDAVVYMAALRKWSEANPNGKPAKKTVSKASNADAKLMFALNEIATLAQAIDDETIPALKAKKTSTAHLTSIVVKLHTIIQQTAEVKA